MFDLSVDRPAFALPPMACDAHFHIIGDPARYPFTKTTRYPPPLATADEYKRFADAVGLERFVLVQPSCFGQDNSCQLDAAKQYGQENCRVVLDLKEGASERELAEYHALGARGIRINQSPTMPPTDAVLEKVQAQMAYWEPRCRELGWSLDCLFPEWLTKMMLPFLDGLRVPFTIAHMGMNKGYNGVGSDAYRALRDFVAGGEGYCWIKLTGAYRISLEKDYHDVIPLARGLIEAAPDRIIWGSDYPHAAYLHHNTMDQLNLLAAVAPDEALRRRILVDNPAVLYAFPTKQ